MTRVHPPELRAHLIYGAQMTAACEWSDPSGSVAVFSAGSPDHATRHNEDAAAIITCNEHLVLVVADGLGGVPGGRMASRATVQSLRDEIIEGQATGRSLRESILLGIEGANRAIRGDHSIGQTTIIVAEIHAGRSLRTYNVGDSAAFVVGQRGRIKLRTLAHSPVGYAVAAGLLEEDEAMLHDDRHFVSNTVGDAAMRIDISAPVELASKDTVVIGSDGLFDNLHLDEIAEAVRKGPLAQAAEQLAATCRERMGTSQVGQPSKPDDLTFILFRPQWDA